MSQVSSDRREGLLGRGSKRSCCWTLRYCLSSPNRPTFRSCSGWSKYRSRGSLIESSLQSSSRATSGAHWSRAGAVAPPVATRKPLDERVSSGGRTARSFSISAAWQRLARAASLDSRSSFAAKAPPRQFVAGPANGATAVAAHTSSQLSGSERIFAFAITLLAPLPRLPRSSFQSTDPLPVRDFPSVSYCSPTQTKLLGPAPSRLPIRLPANSCTDKQDSQ